MLIIFHATRSTDIFPKLLVDEIDYCSVSGRKPANRPAGSAVDPMTNVLKVRKLVFVKEKLFSFFDFKSKNCSHLYILKFIELFEFGFYSSFHSWIG